MQEPFFFSKKGKQAGELFAVFYPPEGEPKDSGVVLCNAFGKEYNLCLSFMINFARLLASRGHAVLRFDYTGYADSQGEFEQATISEMCSDIEAAMETLASKAKVKQLSLVGMRLGGTLSTLVAARQPAVGRLVLWEPIPEPWEYLYAELRQTITMQTVLFKAVKITREEIVQNVLAGRPSFVEGYNLNCIDEGFPLTAELIQQAREVNLIKSPPRLDARVKVVHIRKKEGPLPKRLSSLVESLRTQGTACELETVIEPCIFWTYDPVYATRSEPLYNASVSFLEAP
jgi:pimeloyl-ACP methyl ester carboxylesterase